MEPWQMAAALDRRDVWLGWCSRGDGLEHKIPAFGAVRRAGHTSKGMDGFRWSRLGFFPQAESDNHSLKLYILGLGVKH